MKWLKRFNESKDLNFEEIYDQEIRFIENSMTYIADEYDLSYRDEDVNWSDQQDPENYYHILNDEYRKRTDRNLYGYEHIITIYIMLHVGKFNRLALRKSDWKMILNNKYPNIITKIEKLKDDATKFIESNGNIVETQLEVYKYYGSVDEHLKVRLTFALKRN
jgi:hypothetical protein